MILRCVHSSNEFGHISSTSYGRKNGGVGLPSSLSVFNIFQIISIQSHFQSSQNRNSKPLFLFEIPSMGKSPEDSSSQPP